MKKFIIDSGTDLLGSFTQRLLFGYFWAKYNNGEIMLSKNSNLDDMSGFSKQAKEISDYKKVSTEETEEDHIRYRKTIKNSIITCNEISCNDFMIKLGDSRDIQNLLLKNNINIIINDTNKKVVRENILDILPKTSFKLDKLIAIHFRCGEIVNMKDRFIHSSKYSNILNNLKNAYPSHKIVIFSGTLPPKYIDNLEIFKPYDIYECKPNALETWRIFIEADIFVMARSSFSHCPALLRYSNQKTYYAKFWHPKLSNWIEWYN